jgi:glyoxylase-like metal-dependent hydrolase (beta-lactamase superfamily II)
MLIPLADKLWVVAPEARPVYPYGNCIYIDDKRSAVIDLGAGAKAFAAIPCADIDLALMSHSHFDHIHGNVLFKNAELWAGPEESQTYSDEKFYINFHGYNHWDALMPGISREAYGNVVPCRMMLLPGPVSGL